MLLNHISLAVLWTVYCVLHSVLAGSSLKKRWRQKLGDRFKYYRPAYTLFAFVFLVAILWYLVFLPSPLLFFSTVPLRIAGTVLAGSGLLLMFVCIRKYFISLSGLRSLIQEGSRPELMITGIHRYVRHPLYLGTFAFIWGLLFFFPTWAVLTTNTIITVYTLIGIGLEEKKLVEEFGPAYTQYKQQVPRLLPGRRAFKGEDRRRTPE